MFSEENTQNLSTRLLSLIADTHMSLKVVIYRCVNENVFYFVKINSKLRPFIGCICQPLHNSNEDWVRSEYSYEVYFKLGWIISFSNNTFKSVDRVISWHKFQLV